MSLIDRFLTYADAFEVFFENGDAKVLTPFFSEDAVYETLAEPPFAALHEGREKLFEELAKSLEGFDKRFESRELEMLAGPEARDDGRSVWMRWRVTYRVAGAPALVMNGEETATFEGDRIVRLEDRFAPDAVKTILGWMESHGSKLPG